MRLTQYEREIYNKTGNALRDLTTLTGKIPDELNLSLICLLNRDMRNSKKFLDDVKKRMDTASEFLVEVPGALKKHRGIREEVKQKIISELEILSCVVESFKPQIDMLSEMQSKL